jgi:hypothetical protein
MTVPPRQAQQVQQQGRHVHGGTQIQGAVAAALALLQHTALTHIVHITATEQLENKGCCRSLLSSSTPPGRMVNGSAAGRLSRLIRGCASHCYQGRTQPRKREIRTCGWRSNSLQAGHQAPVSDFSHDTRIPPGLTVVEDCIVELVAVVLGTWGNGHIGRGRWCSGHKCGTAVLQRAARGSIGTGRASVPQQCSNPRASTPSATQHGED